MNQQERDFHEKRKETFKHYGEEMKENVRYSVCNKQQNMLSIMGILQGYINPIKKTRLIVDYDPDFPEALIQIIED